MQTISSNLAKQTFGRVLEKAQREPILIQKHNHPTAVILSVTEYDRLKLSGSENVTQEPKAPIAKVGVSKSLPVISAKTEVAHVRLTAQEMIDLVNEAEMEFSA